MIRECAYGRSCVLYDPSSKVAGMTSRLLCVPCLEAIERDVWALKLDYRDLIRALAGGGGSALSTRVGGSCEPGVPLSLTVDELARDIAWTLTTWEPAVREAAGLGPERARGVRMSWAVGTAVHVIAARVDVLAELPLTWCYADGLDAGPLQRNGLDAVASMRALHRRARSVLGLTRLVSTLPGECSRCGSQSLQRESGSETVTCGLCAERWTWDDYQRYVGLVVASMPVRPPQTAAEPRNTPSGTASKGRRSESATAARTRLADPERMTA